MSTKTSKIFSFFFSKICSRSLVFERIFATTVQVHCRVFIVNSLNAAIINLGDSFQLDLSMFLTISLSGRSTTTLLDRQFFFIFNVFEIFAKIRGKNLLLLRVRTPSHVQEVDSYALSKSQPPTTLGNSQNVEKTIGNSKTFLVSEISFSSFLLDFGRDKQFHTSSKSASSWNFALDGLILRSARPQKKNSMPNGPSSSPDSYKTLGRSIDRIEMNIESIDSKTRSKIPLLKELSRTSRILSNRNPIRKNLGTFGLISSKVVFFMFATFGRIKSIVPGFFRIR